jgi:hypothetical protein
MIRRHRFFVTLRLGAVRSWKNLRLRGVDAPGGAILEDFGSSFMK